MWLLGYDEQVRRRLRVDVADGDEAFGRRDVIALRGRACRRGSRQAATDPLLGHGCAANADELPNRGVDEPRRVVVAVAAAGTVDEDDVVAADLRRPARAAGLVRERAQARAALALHRRRHRVVALGRPCRAGASREDVQLRQPASRATRTVFSNASSSSVGKADDDVAREVELLLQRREPAEERRRGVAPPHRAQHAVVARLQRHVQVPAHRRRLHERGRRARRRRG